MNIELKTIVIYKELSNATVAFSADLYIANSKVGRVSNNGTGGKTATIANGEVGRNLIEKARAHLKTCPPLVYKDKKTFKYPIKIERNLENLIDDLVTKHLLQTQFSTKHITKDIYPNQKTNKNFKKGI